jgi:hypothetical protein
VETLDKEKDLLTRRMGAKLQTLLHMSATFNRYITYGRFCTRRRS